MKILFTFFNPSGGMETLNRIRSRALIERGYECHLLYGVDGEGRKNIKGISTFVTNEDEEIRRILARENYDVIIICTDIYLLQKIRGLGYRGKLIFEVQGLGTLETVHELLGIFDEHIRTHADALLYPQTSHLKQLFQDTFPEIKQFCFDDPLDTERFGYLSYPPKSYRVIGWIGRIVINKNWKEFLYIGAQLLKYDPHLYLWLFEDDTLFEAAERAEYEVMVHTLKLSDRLISHSNVPHELMADYLSIIGDSGGFLCSTSIMEGFGYAVAEAMLCRCPVLTTDSDGVRRFIHHNQTGKFYNRGDINHATQEALSLMFDKNLRANIISSAEEHIKTNFSTSIYTQNFCGMLTNLLHDRC
ncbi:glycosyltransferase family 4 protein [Paenibacillus sp. Marseille-Q4541]|uniref:glycosyltransferase family 4 protein n=1 Tax=Paenibacillus sp. Marseille-Q4541 TaxID=2831522 RepID=UPI001BAD9498|nr:glycosyltransferase family 4 protein [Paenibacillus sp. Marseille-Q4541]